MIENDADPREDVCVGWFQQEIQLPALPQGIHKITDRVVAALPELDRVRVGLLNVFVAHTSASLTINENADPDVLDDLNQWLAAWPPKMPPIVTSRRGATTCRRT